METQNKNSNQSSTNQISKSFNDTEKAKCVICGEIFAAHYLQVTGGIIVLQDTCDNCGKKRLAEMVAKLKKEKQTQESSSLIRLKDKMVMEDVTFVCQDCGKEFTEKHFKISPRPSYCGDCSEKRREKIRKQEEEYQARLLVEKHSEWVNKCGIPLRFKSKTFSNYEIIRGNKLAYDTCLKYADNFPLKQREEYISLGLFSKDIWGVGKTHLACAITQRIIERAIQAYSCPVLYITEYQLFSKIRATYNRGDDNRETEDSILKKLVNAPLLIVDDVGKEEIADPRFVQRIWFALVDGRYNEMQPIMITANLSPDELAHHLGGSRGSEATWDRLYEMLNGKFYEIKDKSHRRKDNG